MKNKGFLSLLLALLLMIITSFAIVNKASAVSLQYQVLQPNGQISHADQYMDKPANVIIKDGKYYVSMSSSVPAWIGSHPVTYTSINNGDGQIVNNAHGASFKFTSTDLSKLIPVTMHLDVKVAKVNMDTIVYLKFLNVPALSSGNTNSGDQSAASGTTDNGATSEQPADGSANNADNSNNPDEKKVTIKKPVKLNQKNKKPTKSGSSNGDSVIYPDKDKKKTNDNKSHYIVIGSGTVVLVAIVAGIVYYRKRTA